MPTASVGSSGPSVSRLAEVRAIDEAHRQEGRAVDLAGLVERDDVGVVDRGREVRLAVEAGPEVGVLRQLVGQQLEGHLAAQLALLGEVDDTHATAAQDPLDAIRPEVGAQARVGTAGGHREMVPAFASHQSNSATGCSPGR